MRTHVNILGWLQIALGVLDILVAVVVFGLFAGVGLLAGLSGELSGPLVGGAVGTVIGLFLMVTGIPNLLAGWGLLDRKGWARILAMVLGVLNVFKFPYGTLLAIYTFWVLLDDEVKGMFDRGW